MLFGFRCLLTLKRVNLSYSILFKLRFIFSKNDILTQIYSMAMFPNQCAAAHKGAVRSCQGCRQILKQLITLCNNCLFISTLLLRVSQIVIFGILGCHQIFLIKKGDVNLKRSKNTALWCQKLPWFFTWFFITTVTKKWNIIAKKSYWNVWTIENSKLL